MEDAKLREASMHLKYEIDMFHWSVDTMLKNQEDRFLRNAIVESFAIHTRNLIHCFYPKKPHPDDVIANHFFDPPDRWDNLRPQPDPSLGAIYKRVSREVAHLSFKRLGKTPQEKLWFYCKTFQIMEPVIQKFIENASKHKLDDSFSIKEECRSHIEEYLKTSPSMSISTDAVSSTSH